MKQLRHSMMSFAPDGSRRAWAAPGAPAGPGYAATGIGNRRPTSTKPGAPLKAETIATLATVLPEHGVRTTSDLRAAATTRETLKAVERAWRATPGQRSGITWDYALMLAQIPGAAGYGLPRATLKLFAYRGDPLSRLLIDTRQADNIYPLIEQIRHRYGRISLVEKVVWVTADAQIVREVLRDARFRTAKQRDRSPFRLV